MTSTEPTLIDVNLGLQSMQGGVLSKDMFRHLFRTQPLATGASVDNGLHRLRPWPDGSSFRLALVADQGC